MFQFKQFSMPFSKQFSVALALAILLLSASCVETVLATSFAGGSAIVRDKSFADTKKDVLISTKIAARFLKAGLKNYGNSVDITVNEGRVLLTGIVRDLEKAKSAANIAWKVKDVKEVIDELQVRPDETVKLADYSHAASDYAITTMLESKMLTDKKILTLNYQTTTVDGTVYILGIAKNSVEKRRVLSLASKIRGVKKVVDHIILANDARRNG